MAKEYERPLMPEPKLGVEELIQMREEDRIDKLRELGDCLHARRVELGLSARKTAKLVRISAPYLIELEHGNNPKTHRPSTPSFEVLARIDEILGLNGETYELAGYPPTGLPIEQPSYVGTRRLERRLQVHFSLMRSVLLSLDRESQEEMLAGLEGLIIRYRPK